MPRGIDEVDCEGGAPREPENSVPHSSRDDDGRWSLLPLLRWCDDDDEGGGERERLRDEEDACGERDRCLDRGERDRLRDDDDDDADLAAAAAAATAAEVGETGTSRPNSSRRVTMAALLSSRSDLNFSRCASWFAQGDVVCECECERRKKRFFRFSTVCVGVFSYLRHSLQNKHNKRRSASTSRMIVWRESTNQNLLFALVFGAQHSHTTVTLNRFRS
jgi:hypothetical protein